TPPRDVLSAMLISLGQDLLCDRSLGDDTSMEYQRFDGDPHSATLCFLPWRMPYRLAMGMRVVPPDVLACYEMPRAIVSSEPELCVQAVEAVTADAMRLIGRARL